MAMATINGTLIGTVTEDNAVPITASGVLQVLDDDAGENKLDAASVATADAPRQGAYGTFVIDETGAWSYTLSNALAAVQALPVGTTRTDSFDVTSFDGSATQTVVITITGVNDAPEVTSAIVSNANEGSASSALNLLMHASDIDNGETATLTVSNVTYAVDGGAASGTVPAGVGRTGTELTIDPAASTFDTLAAGDTAEIVVSFDVTDVNGASVAQVATITVTGVNDAPTSASDSVAVSEDAAKTLALTDFGSFADVDAGDSLKAVKVVSLPVNGSLALNGVAVIAGQVIAAADIVASKLVYTALANDDTDESLTFRVVDQSDAESATYTLTLDLTAVNDAPTGAVTITGTPFTGNTLTASNTLADIEGITAAVSYQWKSGGVAIDSATGSTFVVTNAQAGTVISVTASYTDGRGTVESVTKAMSATAGGVFTPTDSSTLIGSAGADVLQGDMRTHTMIGGAGNDTYVVLRRAEIVEASAEGVDTVLSEKSFVLDSHVENLTLSGVGKLRGTGNELDNAITGGASVDVLTGLGGADTLTGGLGRDMFVYTRVAQSTAAEHDTVTDFSAAQGDLINLKKVDAVVGKDGNQSFRFIGTAQFSAFEDAAGLLRFDAATHMLQGSVDGDVAVEFAILLTGVNSLSIDSIVL